MSESEPDFAGAEPFRRSGGTPSANPHPPPLFRSKFSGLVLGEATHVEPQTWFRGARHRQQLRCGEVLAAIIVLGEAQIRRSNLLLEGPTYF
jgi:hypothetical protein